MRGVGDSARDGTLYLNLEPGDCHGDDAALAWIVASGVSRVVVGMRHPLSHVRGASVAFLRSQGVHVHLLEARADAQASGTAAYDVLERCLTANEVRACFSYYSCYGPRCCYCTVM